MTKIFVYNVNSVHFLLKSRTAVSKFSEMASSSSKMSRIASKLSPTVNYEQIMKTIRHVVAQSRDVFADFRNQSPSIVFRHGGKITLDIIVRLF